MKRVISKIRISLSLILILVTTVAFEKAVKLHAITPNKQKVVIWDCGGVLMHPPSKFSTSFHYLDITTLAKYFLFSWGTSTRMQQLTFTLLHQIPSKKLHTHPSTHKGMPLPAIFLDWLCGVVEIDELMQLVDKHIEAAETQMLFIDETEKAIVSGIIKNVIFNPKVLSTLSHPIKQAIPLLRKLSQQGYRLMILSNWDKHSFDELFEAPHTHCIFQFFDRSDVMISGQWGLCKPDPTFFKTFLTVYRLEPEDCFFIDDHEENIKAAQSVGIQAHWLTHNNYAALEKELNENGYALV